MELEVINGGMILDWRGNGHWAEGFPRSDFEIGGKKVKFLEHIEGWDMYGEINVIFIGV